MSGKDLESELQVLFYYVFKLIVKIKDSSAIGVRRGQTLGVPLVSVRLVLSVIYYVCSVYGDNKSVTKEIKWSLNGARLLSVEEDNVARIWTTKVSAVLSSISRY